jgi:predicted outer membrane repeat protein
VLNQGTLTVTNSLFDNNNATNFGGSIANTGTLNVSNTTFTSPTVSTSIGGAIANLLTGTAIISNSTFSGNNAGSGGGAIYSDSTATLTLTNVTITGNNATSGNGGGIYNAGTLNVYNSTVSGNTASVSGDNVYQLTGTSNLYNVIIANSGTKGDCVTAGGTINATNSLIESTGSNACGLTTTIGNVIGSDPVLSSLTGSPAYFPLLIGSPAINTGDKTVCTAAPVSNTSQNGVTRSSGSYCDIGAYEYLDSTLPTVDTFTAASPSTSLNIPLTAFTISDEIAVSAYLITTSSTPPTAGNAGWSVSAPTTFTVAGDGTYTLYPWAKDTSDNISAVFGTPRTVIVDAAAPAVSSSIRASASPTNLSSVNFTVTGVDLSDFSLTTSGVSSPAVSGVSGSGSSYTVTVNTGSGNGTLRLDVLNDNSIKDVLLNSLSAGFTGGETYTVSKTIPPATTLVNSVLPTSRTLPVGTMATIFNTVINAGANTASGVTLSISPAPAGSFVYQQTSYTTNAIIGDVNPSIDIASGGVACYVTRIKQLSSQRDYAL